jgi:hypothetical protein
MISKTLPDFVRQGLCLKCAPWQGVFTDNGRLSSWQAVRLAGLHWET